MERKIAYTMVTGVIIPLEAVVKVVEQVSLTEDEHRFPPARVIGKLVEVYLHVFVWPQHNSLSIPDY